MTVRVKPISIRLPEDVAQFVEDRATGQTRTDVIVAALQAEMRRVEAEREQRILAQLHDEPYPDVPAQTATELAEVWRDVDW